MHKNLLALALLLPCAVSALPFQKCNDVRCAAIRNGEFQIKEPEYLPEARLQKRGGVNSIPIVSQVKSFVQGDAEGAEATRQEFPRTGPAIGKNHEEVAQFLRLLSKINKEPEPEARLQKRGGVNSIPIVYQVKSLVQAIAGDAEGPEATEQEFIRTGPIVSQATSTVHAIGNNHEEAAKIQITEPEGLPVSHLQKRGGVNSIPIISQAKSLVQVIAGDAEGAEATRQEFSRTGPIVSQATSAVHVIGNNHEEAAKIQITEPEGLPVSHLQKRGNMNSVPVFSQAKSLVQVIAGDLEGARATQEEFSRTCPVVSQATSAVHAIGNNHEEAAKIQITEPEGLPVSHLQKRGNMNSVPVFSQAKSLVQVIAGDAEGARATQEEFSRTCPVVSQVTSTVHAIGNNHEEARKVQAEFGRTMEAMADGLPVVGHIKGIVHYATGDAEKGEACMIGASKAAATIAGGIVGGPAGAVAAGAAVDLVGTGIKSMVKQEFAPIGNAEAITNIVKGDEHRSGQIFDLVVGTAMDAAGAKSGKSGRTTMKTVAKSEIVLETKTLKKNLPAKLDGERVQKTRVTKEIIQAGKEFRRLDIAERAKNGGVLSKITDTKGKTHSGYSGKPRSGQFFKEISQETLAIRADQPMNWSTKQISDIRDINKQHNPTKQHHLTRQHERTPELRAQAAENAVNAYIQEQRFATPTTHPDTWSPQMLERYRKDVNPPSGKFEGQKSVTEYESKWKPVEGPLQRGEKRRTQSQCAEPVPLNKIPDGAKPKEAIAVQYNENGHVTTVPGCASCATYELPKVYTDNMPQVKVPERYATVTREMVLHNTMDVVKIAAPYFIPHEDETSRKKNADEYRAEIRRRKKLDETSQKKNADEHQAEIRARPEELDETSRKENADEYQAEIRGRREELDETSPVDEILKLMKQVGGEIRDETRRTTIADEFQAKMRARREELDETNRKKNELDEINRKKNADEYQAEIRGRREELAEQFGVEGWMDGWVDGMGWMDGWDGMDGGFSQNANLRKFGGTSF